MTRLMDADANKLKMVKSFLRLHAPGWGGRASFIEDALIVWEGTNYFVVRSGIGQDGVRFTWLADKVGVLCDENSPALMRIAAQWHESHTERAQNPEVLHNSYEDDKEARFTGRWCKSLKKRVVAYAEAKDASYHEDVEKGIEEWEIRKAEEAAYEKAKRVFRAQMFKTARKYGKMEKNYDCSYCSGTLKNGIFIDFSCYDYDAMPTPVVNFRSLHCTVTLAQFDKAVKTLSELDVSP